MSAQCPHEVIAAVCLMPCGCGCDSCVRLAAAAEQEPAPDSEGER